MPLRTRLSATVAAAVAVTTLLSVASAGPGVADTSERSGPPGSSVATSSAGKPAGKLSARELAAFRTRQNYRGDGVKDKVWLASLRQRLGTGEFASLRVAAQPSKVGAAVYGAGSVPTSGSGYSYLSWMYQRRQETSSACGKATVSEMSATVPGPSSYTLSQSTVAAYLGETTSSATNTDEELKALGHFVGQPNFGRSFYSTRWVSDPPTSAQKSQFMTDLKSDIADYRTPVTAGVIEVAGGPHLVGHPNLPRIEHWVIAGGWNTNNNTVYYADSWTGYGYNIPAKAWISTNTFLTAVGGWAYLW